MMDQIFISVIVPTYKEAQNIPVLVEKIDMNMKKADMRYEIIIIDDDSNDGIIEAVDNLKNDYNVYLKVRKNQRGLSSAVTAGFEIAKSDIFVVMDADMSHPPGKIPELVEQITENNCDFVIGSRFVKGGSVYSFNTYRKLNALLSKILARPLTGLKDPLSGFFALRRTVLVNKLNPQGFKIGLEIVVKCNPKKIVEIPIGFQERLYGKSKLSIREQLKYLFHVSSLYGYKLKTFFMTR
jgi:dolichol-phosphate mannosyltransferase